MHTNEIKGYSIPADVLVVIRHIISRIPDLRQIAGAAPQVHLIVDTNVLIEDLRFLAKQARRIPARTGVQELLASETVIGYYPAEALPELEDRLGEIALQDAISLDDLNRIWFDYQQALHICPAGHIPYAMADCMLLRDPTDLPFLALRHLIGADAILTKDADISAAGTPVADPIVVRVDLREWARAKGMHLGVIFGGTMIVGVSILSILAAVEILEGIGRIVAKLPNWLQVLLGVGVITAIIHPRSRAAIGRAVSALGNQLSAAWTELQPQISSMIAEAMDADAQAGQLWAKLTSELPASSTKPTLEQVVYRACSIARQSLTTCEIIAVLEMSGFPAEAMESTAVEDVLRRNESIVLTTSGKWAFIPFKGPRS